MIISVDGSYSNEGVLKNLPEKTTLIGRIRKDTKLHTLPSQSKEYGRKKVYGDRIPTPEEIRQDNSIEWKEIKSWAAGKSHTFDVKVVKDLKWRSAGKNHTLQLVVIRPLAYRLTKGSKLLYRQPAYLICTDKDLEIEKLLQAYLWRWEIEVNFRDEKTVMGCGQAQVRNENAVKNLPAFTTAIYSMLHLAAHLTGLERDKNMLPKANWDPVPKQSRMSTSEVINHFRCQLWHNFNQTNYYDFVKNQLKSKSQRNAENPFISGLFYARK